MSFKDVLVRIMRASWFNSSMLTRNPFRYDGPKDEDYPLFRKQGCRPYYEYNVRNLARFVEPCSPLQEAVRYTSRSEGPANIPVCSAGSTTTTLSVGTTMSPLGQSWHLRVISLGVLIGTGHWFVVQFLFSAEVAF